MVLLKAASKAEWTVVKLAASSVDKKVCQSVESLAA